MDHLQHIADEPTCDVSQVEAAVTLLEGAAVPIISRYRNEATRGLDDSHTNDI